MFNGGLVLQQPTWIAWHLANRYKQFDFVGEERENCLVCFSSSLPLLTVFKKNSGNFCEKKLSYCVGSAWDQRSSPEDCYAPGWCAGHCEQEREVMMEKLCWGGPGGKAENDSTSCKDQRDLCSSLCSSLCWIIYLTQEGESEFFFPHSLFQEENIVWNWFCMISGKIKHSIGRAGSSVLGTPLCG